MNKMGSVIEIREGNMTSVTRVPILGANRSPAVPPDGAPTQIGGADAAISGEWGFGRKLRRERRRRVRRATGLMLRPHRRTPPYRTGERKPARRRSRRPKK